MMGRKWDGRWNDATFEIKEGLNGLNRVREREDKDLIGEFCQTVQVFSCKELL